MPSPLSTTVPSVPSVTTVIVSGPGPSISLSLASRSITTDWPITTEVPRSSTATGASFTGATVTSTTEVAVPPTPSSTVMTKLSAPLKSASGV